MYGRIHSDLCNVPKFLLPGVRLQIKFTEAKPSFYLMNTKANPTIIFIFLDAKLCPPHQSPPEYPIGS